MQHFNFKQIIYEDAKSNIKTTNVDDNNARSIDPATVWIIVVVVVTMAMVLTDGSKVMVMNSAISLLIYFGLKYEVEQCSS